MYNVTNPKTGKTYTYAANNLRHALKLADKFGVLVVKGADPSSPTAARLGRKSSRYVSGAPCPHGDRYGYCDRGACDEG